MANGKKGGKGGGKKGGGTNMKMGNIENFFIKRKHPENETNGRDESRGRGAKRKLFHQFSQKTINNSKEANSGKLNTSVNPSWSPRKESELDELETIVEDNFKQKYSPKSVIPSQTKRKSRKSKNGSRQLSIMQFSPANASSSGSNRKQSSIFLTEDPLDSTNLYANTRVMDVQFARDALTVVPSQQPIRLPLNSEQERVATFSPNKPLSVRAGAGTGKTHTMVQRAANLVSVHGVPAQNILLITFSNKATQELKERVAGVFSGVDSGDVTYQLPTIKTFHSLAFSWICRCWKACGLGRSPVPLATTSQQKQLMRRAIESYIDAQRLERCRKMTWKQSESQNDASWNEVVKAFRKNHEEEYEEILAEVEEEVEKLKPDQASLKKMTAEEQNEALDEVKSKKQYKLRTKIYFKLLELKNKYGKSVACDLERLNGKVGEFLQLVEKARQGRHDRNDYPSPDGEVWSLYEQMMVETGMVDFDMMLTLFTQKLLSHEKLAERFHTMYTHIIVDEYQDNSEDQAEMLNKIVKGGNLTVVGDDDQCIYEFRGASPGNFERLKAHFAENKGLHMEEETLVDNHRCSSNILVVAHKFLEADTRRHPKELRATRESGLPVETWRCSEPGDQAEHIISSMVKRHDDNGVPWGEMACLFRCFKTMRMGCLYTSFEKLLVENRIPYLVVGGTSFFQRENVKDLLAYLALSVKDNYDDDAFARVINKPARRLPKKKLVPLLEKFIKERSNAKAGATPIVHLQEAAACMIKTGVELSNTRRRALKEFLDQIKQWQKQVNRLTLPDLLRYLWRETGLEKSLREKASKRKIRSASDVSSKGTRPVGNGSEKDSDSDDSDAENGKTVTSNRNESGDDFVAADSDDSDTFEDGGSNSDSIDSERTERRHSFPSSQSSTDIPERMDRPGRGRSEIDCRPRVRYSSGSSGSQRNDAFRPPVAIQTLIEVASKHVEKWKKREECVVNSGRQSSTGSNGNTARSLVDFSREALLKNKDSFDDLPDHIVVDEILLAPEGLGRSVVCDFLAEIALQQSVPEEGGSKKSSNHDTEKVSISTVHRAKGLEWTDVYVPYFNQGFLPTNVREEDKKFKRRHVRSCDAFEGGKCNRSCAVFFAQKEAELKGSIEERHLNEERRLAHVAATRAKDRLVLTSFTESIGGWKTEESQFLGELRTIPDSKFKVIDKVGIKADLN